MISSARRHRAQCPAPIATGSGKPSRHDGCENEPPRSEEAAGGPRPGTRRLTLHPLEHVGAGRVGDRPQEAARVRMRGRAERRIDRPVFDQPPGVHDPDRCRDVGDDRQVVAHVHRPDLVAAAQGPDRIEDVALGGHVETGGRLVEDDQLRAAGECHGQHHALLLPAGELMRIALEHPGRPRRAGRRPARRRSAPRRRPRAVAHRDGRRRSRAAACRP